MEKAQSQQKIHVSICNLRNGEKILPYCMNDGYCCPLCSYKADESFKMPLDVLEAVLQEVILAQGDAAYLTLALTCKRFKAIVSDPVFRKRTHFAWLDGEINWGKFSKSFKAENRIPFAVVTCSSCNRQYKDCVGFTGNGRRGDYPRYYCDGIPGHCPGCQY